MPSSFSALKQARSKEFDKLNSQLQSMNSSGPKGDEDYWKLEVDKAGNGYAVLRFLPAPPGEDTPFVRIWDHGFQGPGGWYIENSLTTIGPPGEDTPFVRIWDHGFQGPGGWYIEKSLTTIGQDDPVSEYNSKLWNSGVESDKDIARKQKRRLGFHANVYVVKDPANPQNEGKVFKYKFGKKIFDKLNDIMNPQFEDEEAINPFDFWEGADFKLKARNVEGYRNYDKSEFSSPGRITKTDGSEMTDEEMESIWNSQKPRTTSRRWTLLRSSRKAHLVQWTKLHLRILVRQIVMTMMIFLSSKVSLTTNTIRRGPSPSYLTKDLYYGTI